VRPTAIQNLGGMLTKMSGKVFCFVLPQIK